MVIFHCQAKSISRGSGRSVTAAAAYRSGEIIEDFRTREVHDYSRKQGVCYTALLTRGAKTRVLDSPKTRGRHGPL